MDGKASHHRALLWSANEGMKVKDIEKAGKPVLVRCKQDLPHNSGALYSLPGWFLQQRWPDCPDQLEPESLWVGCGHHDSEVLPTLRTSKLEHFAIITDFLSGKHLASRDTSNTELFFLLI